MSFKKFSNIDSLPTYGEPIKKSEENVDFIGKFAKFPNNIEPTDAENFLNNIHIPMDTIWYILVEKDPKDTSIQELQLIKYKKENKIDLMMFVDAMIKRYIEIFDNSSQQEVSEALHSLEINLTDEVLSIKNIRDIDVFFNNQQTKLITMFTVDLIELLNNI